MLGRVAQRSCGSLEAFKVRLDGALNTLILVADVPAQSWLG